MLLQKAMRADDGALADCLLQTEAIIIDTSLQLASNIRRAAAAGALALGSKAAIMLKGGGGVGTLAKAAGLIAVGGALILWSKRVPTSCIL